ncbi:hypothetical protein RC1_3869 [Rhodospirillum centenum SW]|uniref:Uncharacterized protein n=1 Tax=Rhodospirillum centenum (strain ATCC 51521 / SW) TaxID=414684 RepID=B6IY38_RHOCS|nr:hypothetical protein RC1_3869 [Rhodospirillum centenum SW]
MTATGRQGGLGHFSGSVPQGCEIGSRARQPARRTCRVGGMTGRSGTAMAGMAATRARSFRSAGTKRKSAPPGHPAQRPCDAFPKAGLLACGSRRSPGLPSFPVAMNGRALAAHSCGGSRGLGPCDPHRVPFSPLPGHLRRAEG